MSIKNLFETSDKLESEGIWIDYGNEQVRILRAGARNTRYKELFARLTKPHMAAIKREALPEETSEKIMYRCYAEAIVIDWRCRDDEGDWHEGHMLDENGEPTPMSSERIQGMFKKYPDFFVDLKNQSENATLFRDLEIEDQGKE